jgi:hypothetical protein
LAQKLHLYPEIQTLPDKPPCLHFTWRLSNTNQRKNRTYELPKYEEHHIHASSIKVKRVPCAFTIIAAYCPPRQVLIRIHFESLIPTLSKKFIAGGDFNSRHTVWGSRPITTIGRELYKTIHDNNYTIISTEAPTY